MKACKVPHRFIPSLEPDRPLVLCDADEVLLQFMGSFERHLHKQGYLVSLKAFRLAGNIRHRASGNIASQQEVERLLAAFFDEQVDDIPAVDGAVSALQSLAARAQILIISNVPAHVEARRQKALEKLGMHFPLLSNKGPKGPVVCQFYAAMRAPVFFIDDLPPHHKSVAELAPDVYRVHFIADPRLAALIDKADHADFRVDTWPEAAAHLHARLDMAGCQ